MSANTQLLLHLDSDFSDATGNNIVSTVGDTQISSARSKFGGASALFDGAGDGLTIDSNPSIIFGTGDFTVEAWVYCTASATQQRMFSTNHGAMTANSFLFSLNSSNRIFAYVGTDPNIATSDTNMLFNEWVHVAVTRASDVVRGFQNGVQVFSMTSGADISGAIVNIGKNASNQYWNGNMDEIRFSDIARWTEGFTPSSEAYSLGGSSPTSRNTQGIIII